MGLEVSESPAAPQKKGEENVWVAGGREEDPAPKDKIQWEETQARRVFFKDTRNERKQETPRGLRVRELKLKMEIYQSGN